MSQYPCAARAAPLVEGAVRLGEGVGRTFVLHQHLLRHSAEPPASV